MNNPLISVIVPVYNVSKYLRRCVDSIIKQTYINLEILLIDDGSTDDSGIICDHYKNIDKRIVVVHKKNGGLSSARNVGINVCKGMYISFVDSDDYVDTNFIYILFKTIVKHNCLVSGCGTYILNGDKKTVYRRVRESFVDYNEYFSSENSVNVWDKLFHKKLFEEIRFPEGKKCEDSYIIYELLYKAKYIALTKDNLYYYFQRDDSIVHNHSKNFYYDMIQSRYQGILFLRKFYISRKALNKLFFDFFKRYGYTLSIFKKSDADFCLIVKGIYNAYYDTVKNDLNLMNRMLSRIPLFFYRIRKIAKVILFPLVKLKHRL